MQKGITLKICMLCLVIIYSVLFLLLLLFVCWCLDLALEH